MERVLERARVAVEGVPEETRGPREDGTTFYMRPLPGGARMYPETDVPPVKITREMWEEVLRDLPPLPEEMAAHLVERYGISEQQAWQLIRDGTEDVFEDIASHTAYPGVVARVLLNLLPEMERDGLDVGRVTPEVLMEVFSRLDKGEFAKEGVEEILRAVASGKSPEEAISALRGGGEEELRDFIRRALEERRDFVVERGERAFSAIMGVVMKEFRGRVDGKVISEMVRDELRKFLEEG
jgi:glutamyl-tRNA(Gln) amidotransferase subunit E